MSGDCDGNPWIGPRKVSWEAEVLSNRCIGFWEESPGIQACGFELSQEMINCLVKEKWVD